MLEFELTKRHTGIRLWGDHATLTRLHTFVHHVVEDSPLIENKEGFVLGLAYDLRKAYEGQRSTGIRGHFEEDTCPIFGVEILWPVLLLQTALLRQAMAMIPTNRLDQALMYELEHVVETALRKAAPARADDVLLFARIVSCAPYAHLELNLDSRCVYFVEASPSKRLAMLVPLLRSLQPGYEALYASRKSPRKDWIDPAEFDDDDREWPEFEW